VVVVVVIVYRVPADLVVAVVPALSATIAVLLGRRVAARE
jgi:hypothetical protein